MFILLDFIKFCVGFRFRLIQILAKWCSGPPENLNISITGLFCETLNISLTVLVFDGFKRGIRDFCDAYT